MGLDEPFLKPIQDSLYIVFKMSQVYGQESRRLHLNLWKGNFDVLTRF